MLPVVAASDIAVLSSDNEGTPVSLIEAAAAATPAVTTTVGGVPDVVNDGTGLLAPAGDFESLGRAMAALAADPEGRAAMGARARAHVAGRFSVGRLVTDVENLYDLLVPLR
jgi:glycosyltransferase involved in cell wall biosynthesis